jgi:glycosyltransferase involved in cell wall biosynthesis
MHRPDLSVIPPAYNASSVIESSVHEVLAGCRLHGFNGEIMVVDDGSKDNTYSAVPRVQRVQVLTMGRNRGEGAAVRAGMTAATGSSCLYTDADLPYGTASFEGPLSAIIDEGNHAAIGDRTMPESSYRHPGVPRRVVSGIATWLIRRFITEGVFDTQCGLKAFRADVARALFKETRIDGFAGDMEVVYLLLRHRLRFKRIPVIQIRDAPSTIRLTRDSLRAGFDILRLRVANRTDTPPSAELERIRSESEDCGL